MNVLSTLRSGQRRSLTCTALALLTLAASSRVALAADFVKPSAQELSMSSLPGYPGASAVILYREEITRDDMHSVEHYDRIKILTEEGKKYANVELGFVTVSGDYFGSGDGKTMDGIAGRTIHADGTVIPFTGKPYVKVLEKTSGYKIQQRIFTLPDVEVGSIIEYRYVTRINDNIVEAPIWRIQDELYLKDGHFVWWPTSKTILDEDEKPINAITWLPILPPGAKLETTDIAAAGLQPARRCYEVHVKDVPPELREEYMPPLRSFTYRVNFAFSPYSGQQEYWQAQGKQWSKHFNSFANPNSQLKAATAKVVEGATTPDARLRKIYAAVEALENTEFTRQRDAREDKSSGATQVRTVADVLANGRGTPYQLTALFIGMARAAGLPAFAMRVPDRSDTIFVPAWMDTRQFDTIIAIVSVDGSEKYFDPGSRYTPFGQLAWQHTVVGGQRQTANGTELFEVPGQIYTENRLSRVANLTLTTENEVSGKIDLKFTGAPAVRWREAALRGDEESLRKELRQNLEKMIPRTLEVEVAEIKQLADYDQPLVVSFRVKGALGTATGKRVMVPADIFTANTTATFPHEKRESAIYFHYPELVQDAVRITFPQQLAIEATPSSSRYVFQKTGAYNMDVKTAGNSVIARRDFALNNVLLPNSEYKELRGFYSQLETKDLESIILKPASSTTAAATAPGGGSTN